MLFIECRFEGGYGDDPSEGQLLRQDGALVARFDRCEFSRLHLHPGDTTLFNECVLADLCEDPRNSVALNEGVRFRNCRFENNWLPRQRKRMIYLEVLFPKWRERIVD